MEKLATEPLLGAEPVAMPGAPAMATIMLTDLVGSTAQRGALGEELADELRRRHDELLSARIARRGGRVVKGSGDGLLAVFESASEALTAAVEIQQAIAAHNRAGERIAELAVRIGISAGDVTWEDGDCFGTPVVEAARLEAAAQGGQILCSELVRLMARGRGGHQLTSLGELELKGLPEPVTAYEVAWEPAGPALRLPLPPSLAAAADEPCVGRAAELAELTTLTEHTARASASVVWLTGEPGIGKTRLAGEWAQSSHAAGWTVLFGRCDEALQVPYQPFAEALRHYVTHTPEEELTDEARGSAELASLCPELAARRGGDAAPDDVDQYRLFESVRRWLGELAAAAPAALVIDDAQWATGPTLLLLNYLARTLETGRVALVTTARDTEGSTELGAIVDETALRPGGLHLRLTGLGPDAVAELAGDDSAELYEQTAGNPLFVRAVRASGERGVTLGAAIRRRVTRLEPGTQDALRLAALAGLEFDLRVVARATSTPLAELLERCEEATRAGLLEEVATNRFGFAHGLVRDALHDEIAASRRVLGHRSLAVAYEELQPGAIAAIARHWAEAASDPESTGKAVSALTLAGDAALAASDHDGAARAFQRALDLVGDVVDPARAELLYALGRARVAAGELTTSTEALLLRAAECAQRLGLAELWVEALELGGTIGAEIGRPSSPACEAIARCATQPPEDARLRARIRAVHANSLAWLGRSEDSARACREALAEAEAVGDDQAIAWAHNGLFVALAYARAHERASHADLSLGHGQRAAAGHAAPLMHHVLPYWRMNASMARLAQGRTGEVAHGMEAVSAEADRRRDPFLRQMVALARSTLAYLRGDFEAAERSADAAEALAEGVGGMDGAGPHGVQMYSIRREQGRLAEVAPAMRLIARLDSTGTWRPGLAAVFAELGMATEASAELDKVVVGHVVDVSDDAVRPLSASYLADAAAALGDAPKAAALYDLMHPWSGLTISMWCVACYGPVDRYLGMLAYTMHQLALAESHLRAALEQCRAMGTPVYEAHTRYWLARVAEAQADLPTADEEAAGARAVAERIGMAGLLRRLDAFAATRR